MKILLSNYILLLLLGWVGLAQATEQIKERVSIGDGDLMFYGYPLEQLISDSDFRETYGLTSPCSAAWRGYQGQWIIHTGKLYLAALIKDPCRFELELEETFDLTKILPDYDFATPAQAIWFTGEIVIPISEYRAVNEIKHNSDQTYYLEHQVIVYQIKNGNVETRTIEFRER